MLSAVFRATRTELLTALAGESQSSATVLDGAPKPLLEVAIAQLDAINRLDFPENKSAALTRQYQQNWIDGPQRQYGVCVSNNIFGNMMPFLWLVGYKIEDRANAHRHAMRALRGEPDNALRGFRIIWAPNFTRAIFFVMELVDDLLRRHSVDVDSLNYVRESLRLCTKLYAAYEDYPTDGDLHFAATQISTCFNVRTHDSTPELLREGEWFLGIAMREY